MAKESVTVKPLPKAKLVAFSSSMAALIAITTLTAIPMPPPLSTITLAPITIFVTAILMGPIVGLISSAIGSGVGFIAGATIGTIAVPAGYFSIFLLGIVIARGPMGLTIGLLRKKNEVVAMIAGILVETAIFFAADVYLFGLAVALITLGTLIDLIYVPVTYGILRAVRKGLGVKYLV